MLESAINGYLQHYRLRVSIRAGYVMASKWCDTVGECRQGVGRLEFRFPYPSMPQTGEGHTLEVDELVEIVSETHSENCYEQVIHVLSRYNDHHGHRFQQAVDRLRSRLDALRCGQTKPRLTEQVVVESGGTHISRSRLEGACFGIAERQVAAPHKVLDSH